MLIERVSSISERPRSPVAAGWRSGCFSSPSDSWLPFGASHCSLFCASLTDVEREGCHIILGVDSPSAGKGSGPWLQGLRILLADDCAAIRLGHWPSEHRLCAPSTGCLTCRARIRSRSGPSTHNAPPRRTIFWLLISDANVRGQLPLPVA